MMVGTRISLAAIVDETDVSSEGADLTIPDPGAGQSERPTESRFRDCRCRRCTGLQAKGCCGPVMARFFFVRRNKLESLWGGRTSRQNRAARAGVVRT